MKRKQVLLQLLTHLLMLTLAACGGGGSGGGEDGKGGTGQGDNQPPTASFSTNTTIGSAPFQVLFNAEASSDPDGIITTYAWTFGDGRNGTGAIISHTYSSAGTYTATLSVTDNSGDTDTASASVTVNPTTPGTFSLSGTITSAHNIDVDSDLNDPLAPYTKNDAPADAQRVNNPVMLNGFANRIATGVTDDRFGANADISDYYRASLYSGQYVSLRVVSFDATSPTTNDVDILLFDDNLNLVAASTSITEFESMIVPADGDYYIQVQAYSGINSYLLSIDFTSMLNSREADGWPGDFVPHQAIIKRNLQVAGARSFDPLDRQPGMVLSHDKSDRPALLHLKSGASLSETLSPISGRALIQTQDTQSAALPEETRKKIETLSLIKQLNQQQEIASATPNFRLKTMLEPNDSYYSYQEHYRQIHLPQAWDITTGTPAAGSVIIAVVDTGIAMDHEDFDGQLVAGYDFISDVNSANDGDGIDSDPNDPGTSTSPGESVFHGTHVAGTLAAASNNGRGVAGIAWGAKIMPLRALGLGGWGTYYDIMQAIRYAAGLSNDSNKLPPKPADIINLSLGGGGYIQAFQDLFTEVRAAGVIVTAAAGNDGSELPFYPASYDGVISVSAMDWQNEKAPYSNFGAAVDVGAPGGNMWMDSNGDGYGDGVMSCIIDDASGVRTSGYAYYQGTSMASPHMAGVIALMKALHPGLTPRELDILLISGKLTNDLGTPGRDDIYGYGMIDALKAVEAAQNASINPTQSIVVASPSSINLGTTRQMTSIDLSGYGDTPPKITHYSSSEPWLTVIAGMVDEDGLGEYILTIDRNGLDNASYTAMVDFGLSSGKTISVPVTMHVLNQQTGVPGNAGLLYLLLVDSTVNNQSKLMMLNPTDGEYHYRFEDVMAGNYYLIAGSDVDNDMYICELGESCGVYSVTNQAELVMVDRDINGLDFTVAIDSGSSSDRISISTTGIALEAGEKAMTQKR